MKLITVKNISGIIFLGAIGSGIWSLFGQPFIEFAYTKFIEIAHVLNEGYYDLIHSQIGKGHREHIDLWSHTRWTSIFIIWILGLPIISFLLMKKVHREDDKSKIKENKVKHFPKFSKRKFVKLNFFFILTYSLIAIPVFVSGLVKNHYTNNAIVFTERSIEILAPYISSQEHLFLRSKYRSVENADEFYQLYDQLQSFALDHEVEIPGFDVAR